MSVSIEQKRDYAAHVLNHAAREDFMTDVLMKLFNEWLATDDMEQWRVIKGKRDGLRAFMQMAAIIETNAVNPEE